MSRVRVLGMAICITLGGVQYDYLSDGGSRGKRFPRIEEKEELIVLDDLEFSRLKSIVDCYEVNDSVRQLELHLKDGEVVNPLILHIRFASRDAGAWISGIPITSIAKIVGPEFFRSKLAQIKNICDTDRKRSGKFPREREIRIRSMVPSAPTPSL